MPAFRQATVHAAIQAVRNVPIQQELQKPGLRLEIRCPDEFGFESLFRLDLLPKIEFGLVVDTTNPNSILPKYYV